MISTEELPKLLANLYAAPLEPWRWRSFLDHLCSLCNVSAGYLLGGYPSEEDMVLAGAGLNYDPEALYRYKAHYRVHDPYSTPLLANPRIGLLQSEELVPRDKLVRLDFYQEHLCRYGMEHMTLLSYNCTRDGADALALWRGPKDGPPDDPTSRLLESLIPHLRTALLLRKRLAASHAAQTFAEAALDSMSIAAFLVTAKGQIRHMNRLAAAHLGEAGCLRLDSGRLTANDPTASSGHLERLIAQAASNETPALDHAPGGSMRLSHFNVTVVPAPEHNQIAAHELYALVFVTDTRQPTRSRAAVMRQLYGLTPAEARVTDGLLDGLELRETADRLGITLETCRFHIKRVFAKTGTRRQAELIRLMLSLPGQ